MDNHSPAGQSGPGQKLNTHPHSSKVDLSNASRGIWLVKVPKYLAGRFEKIPGNIEAGKLKIARTTHAGQKPKVTFSLSEATLLIKEPGEDDIPKDHELIVAPISNQTLEVFSVVPGSKDEIVNTGDIDKISLEGKVQQKLECRPFADSNYLALKLKEIVKASQPTRQVKQLDKHVLSFKPIANHKNNIEYEERKKAEGKKSRDDKDKVLEMLYAAFEKHQYYNVKDLVRITNQPISYLKELLKEYCNYCMKSPHKNMWELKPEFRHYAKADDDDDD